MSRLPLAGALPVGAGFRALASVAPADLGRQGLALGLALCALLRWFGVARLSAWRQGLHLEPLPGFQPSDLAKLALSMVLAGTLIFPVIAEAPGWRC